MSRYLSSAKLCILVLIQLYRSGEVANDNRISLLSFISNFILVRNSLPDSCVPDSKTPRLTCINHLRNLLQPLVSKSPGRSLYDVFLRSVWSIAGFEQLGELLKIVC